VSQTENNFEHSKFRQKDVLCHRWKPRFRNHFILTCQVSDLPTTDKFARYISSLIL